MNDYINVVAIVEGKTEQVFIEQILKPYLAQKMIFMAATQVSKAGQKGGDVKFSRVINDIGNHLKQRPDTYVTTLIDYYGTKEWPGLDEITQGLEPQAIATCINQATKIEVDRIFLEQQAQKRFIPYIAIHEFEALLFSDSAKLAIGLDINEDKIVSVLNKKKQAEAINDSPQTAPSKRLDGWYKTKKFPKTTLGIKIAKEIGIDKMREKCPVFNLWIERFEALV